MRWLQMTTKNSICIKCENLIACTTGCFISNGEKALISSCKYGGKNAGDRKTCKQFQPANEFIIAARFALLRKGEKK